MQKKQRIAVRPIASGLKDSRNPLLLSDGETPFAENVEFDRDSLKEVGGSVKFNNRPAPPAAIRTVAPLEPQPLTSRVDATNVSVPMRGYVVVPYSKEQDIGGQTFHDTSVSSYTDYRGRSFNLKISFKLPEGTKLYGPSGTTGEDHYGNQNEALGECFLIAQKGGDRFQPMSWALGVVNVGDSEVYDMITGGSNFGEAGSTYRLVFMWLDVPKFGFSDPEGGEDFKYTASSGSALATGTMALRSIVIDQAIDVGKNYHVSFSLKMDTGSVTTTTGTFNDDGEIRCNVSEDFEAPVEYSYLSSGDVVSGMYVWTGPSDSLNYFCRYGVRFAGRDEMYLGLGYRTLAIIPGGSVPWGMDASPLEHGGHSMNTNAGVKTYMDADSDAILGTITHVSGEGFVTISRQHVTRSGSPSNLDVLKSTFGIGGNAGGNVSYPTWQGQGNSTNGTHNTEALRGYHVVESSATTSRIMTISSYSETGTFEFNCFNLTASTDTISAEDYWIYPFRWHQRDLILSDFRVYAREGSYSTDRETWGLHASADLTDPNEPDIEHLVGYWPLDDGGGGVCKDLVSANDAFFAPMQMGVSERGVRGENQVFLSGEGEAIVLDLSDNPIFEREFLQNLRHDNMGVAVQITMKLTGAEYSMQQIHPDPEIPGTDQLVAAWGADIIKWEIKDPDGAGMGATPTPLLKFGYHSRSSTSVTSQIRYRYPLGFGLEVADGNDQSGNSLKSALQPWDGNTALWDVFNVPWAGKTVTFQLGIQPGPTAGSFVGYITGAPAGILARSGDLEGNDPNGEFALFTSEFVIDDKDLSRSVITIGGGWIPGSFGMQHTCARMIVDEVRVFAANAPGTLPAATRDVINDRSGKILGSHSLPQTELFPQDLVQDLGLGVTQVEVTDGSTTVKAVSVLEFFGGDPEATDESIEGAFLIVAQDKHIRIESERLGEVQEEFYRIKSLTGSAASASGKSELELHTPYEGQTVSNIQARAFRMVGYCSFADEFKDIGLPTSTGNGFDPATATVDDVVVSPDLWFNRAAVTGNWALRLYSPLSGMSIHQVAPQWTTGFMEPRRNPIRGMHSLNDRLYCQAGATLFEVDDRWRITRDGVESLTWLEFRSQDVGRDRLHAPLAGDRLTFTNMDEVVLDGTNTDVASVHKTRVMDCEVELNVVRGLQTMFQVLNEDTFAGEAADTDAWEMNHWSRLRDGQPQLVLGRDATFDGSNNPDRNLWVATADTILRPNERTHIRWIVEDEESANDLYLAPICCVNGKKVEVTLSATENTFTGDQWVGSGTAVPTADAATLLIGCAVDFYEENSPDTTYVDGEIRGEYLSPKFHSGYLHSLNGRLRNLVIGNDDSFNAASNTSDTDYNFDWRNITYPAWGAGEELVNVSLDEGVGHKAKEEATDIYGLVYSSPFIGLYSGMDKRDQHATFTAVGDQVFCTNGGRPVVFDQDFGARQAGLIPPKSAPDFEINRLPLWVKNTTEDPVETSHAHHYSTRGNSYLLGQYNSQLLFSAGDTFAFKAFVRPNSVHGRIPLYSSRNSLTSGGMFVEIVDGKCRQGWYDTVLKKEVYVETSTQVFYPGFWHYVYVRKNFPTAALGGWNNQIVVEDNSDTFDMMVVRVLQDSTVGPTTDGWLPNMYTADASPVVTNKLHVSYTADHRVSAGTTTASGLCTPAAAVYTGSTGGTVTRDAAANTFVDDMIGRFWQWDTASNADIYRIISITSNSVLTVRALDGGTPNFTGITSKNGGVFMGAELVKSEDYDIAVNVDPFNYDSEFFGSAIAAFPLSGITPFNGSFASFGMTNAAGLAIFQTANTTDEARTGTDGFDFHPDEGTEMGELTFAIAGGFSTHWVAQDSEPNEDLEIVMAATASPAASTLVWQNSNSIQMLSGFRRVRVTFFDTQQNVESNPGPELLIEPSGEDETNSSGAARILIKDIPLSPQRGRIIRRIYMSLADGGVLFRVAELEDNVSASVVIYKTEFAIGQGDFIQYDRNSPPKCDVVSAGNGIMWYGGLALQPNGVLFSKPFEPAAVPFSNFLLFDTGDNSPVTGMAEHAGRMLIFKRDAVFAATVVPGGVVQETISRGAGSVNHNCIQQIDDRLYFIDSRGLQHMAPFGEPQRICEDIENFFNNDWDLNQQKFVVGGLNRTREQYIFCTKEIDSDYPDVRYAAELVGNTAIIARNAATIKHRFSRFKGPNVTALATLWDKFGDNYKLVAGTEEGFAVWMDRTDTQLCMMGSDTNIWGDPSLTVSTPTAAGQTIGTSAGTLDTGFSGARGAKIRFQDASDIESEAIILAVVGTTIILDRSRTRAVLVGDATILGDTRPQYRSKWFDLGIPEITKKSVLIDLSRQIESSGTLVVTTYQDFSNTVIDTILLDLTQALGHYSTTAHGGVLQFRFAVPYAQFATKFELIDMVWRVQYSDTW